MTCRVVLTLNNGQVINGVSYRMDAALAAIPSCSAGFNGGEFHIKTARGWVDVPVINTNPPPPLAHITVSPSNPSLAPGGLT
jgi:hypothetical protein